MFVAPAAASARPGDLLALDGPEARHAVTVQRRRVGEVIDLVDGAGTRARGPIEAVGDGALEIRVEAVSRDDDPEVVLVQALAKGGRDEQAVEAAVELGATRIVPWAAARCIVQWKGPKAAKGRASWESQALAAAKQSRRALVPAVDPAVATPALAALVRDAVAAGARVLILHEEAAVPLTSLTWDDARTPVWCIVGPEGGIADDEVTALTEAGAVPVVLGPHVLRASSAGPAAIAALAAGRGTWNTLGA